MREDDESLDDSDDELGSESDDLVDERNAENEIMPEVERPQRAKPGFRKPYVKKRQAKGTAPTIRPKLKG